MNARTMDSVTAGTVRIAVCAFNLRFTVRPTCAPAWYIDREGETPAGRVQIGQQVSIFSQCIPGGKPVQPTTAGTVRIYGGTGVVRSAQLPVESTDEDRVGLFRGHFSPDNRDSPGRYVALLAFYAEGHAREEAIAFELIPGGHALGAVISSFSTVKPDATIVLAHTESGKITTGRGPYLDEGI